MNNNNNNNNNKITEHFDKNTISAFYEKNKVLVLLSIIWIVTIIIEVILYLVIRNKNKQNSQSQYGQYSELPNSQSQYGQYSELPNSQSQQYYQPQYDQTQYGQTGQYDQTQYSQPQYGGVNKLIELEFATNYDIRENIIKNLSDNLIKTMIGGGGANGILALPIIMAIIASFIVIYKYTKRNKCIAYLLNMIPLAPLNRIYTGHFNPGLGTLFRMFVPILGQMWDFYSLWSGKMVPTQGWSGDGTCNIFSII